MSNDRPTGQPTNKPVAKVGDLRFTQVDVPWSVRPFLRVIALLGFLTETETVTGVELALPGIRGGLFKTTTCMRSF